MSNNTHWNTCFSTHAYMYWKSLYFFIYGKWNFPSDTFFLKNRNKFTYLPIWLQTSESEQTAPFLKICRTDPDGGCGISGFGGINPIFGTFGLLSFLDEHNMITIVRKIIETIKIDMKINFCFFVKLDKKQDL